MAAGARRRRKGALSSPPLSRRTEHARLRRKLSLLSSWSGVRPIWSRSGLQLATSIARQMGGRPRSPRNSPHLWWRGSPTSRADRTRGAGAALARISFCCQRESRGTALTTTPSLGAQSSHDTRTKPPQPIPETDTIGHVATDAGPGERQERRPWQCALLDNAFSGHVAVASASHGERRRDRRQAGACNTSTNASP